MECEEYDEVSHIKEDVKDTIKDVENGTSASDALHFVEEYLELLNLLDDYFKKN